MRDKYWAMYTALKHKEQYYLRYQICATRWNGIVNAICLFASGGGIVAWGEGRLFPLLCAFIIFLAQITQSIKPLLPFSQQLISLKFLNPELSSLLIEIDYSWDRVTRIDESDPAECEYVSNLIKDYEKKFASLTSQFIGDTYFPIKKRCDKAAEEECRRYFKHKYNV